MSGMLLQFNQTIKNNQLYVVVTLFNYQINVALGGSLKANKTEFVSGCTVLMNHITNYIKVPQKFYIVYTSILIGRTSVAYLNSCGSTGEGYKSASSLVLNSWAWGLKQIVDTTDKSSTLWRVGMTNLGKGEQNSKIDITQNTLPL